MYWGYMQTVFWRFELKNDRGRPKKRYPWHIHVKKRQTFWWTSLYVKWLQTMESDCLTFILEAVGIEIPWSWSTRSIFRHNTSFSWLRSRAKTIPKRYPKRLNFSPQNRSPHTIKMMTQTAPLLRPPLLHQNDRSTQPSEQKTACPGQLLRNLLLLNIHKYEGLPNTDNR